MVDEDRDGGDFYREAGCDLVSRSVLGATEGVDTDVLMGVFIVLVNARGVREDDCGRNVLLFVKMRERRQGTGRRDRGQGYDGVMERSGWAQTSIGFCGGFYGGRDI